LAGDRGHEITPMSGRVEARRYDHVPHRLVSRSGELAAERLRGGADLTAIGEESQHRPRRNRSANCTRRRRLTASRAAARTPGRLGQRAGAIRACAGADLRHSSGSSSRRRPCGHCSIWSFVSTSVKYARGSTPLSRHVAVIV